MAKYQYRGCGVVEFNGYRWVGRAKRGKAVDYTDKKALINGEPNDTFGETVDVPESDVPTNRKLRTHPSFRLIP